MKPVECIAEEALGEVLALPDGDLRRAHLASCPRCQALALSYRAFEEPAEGATSAYGEREAAALTTFRERLLGLAEAPGASRDAARRDAPDARGAASGPRGATGGARGVAGGAGGWARIFSPALRPAWALAALVLAGGAIVLWQRPFSRDTESLVRGTARQPLALASPRFLEGGEVRLEWGAEPAATRYELRFYSTALIEIGRFDAGAEPHATLGAADLPAEFADGAIILYRVAALRGRDELAISATQSLRKP